jgi:hypothetical protein
MSTIALRAASKVTGNTTYYDIADSNVNAIYSNSLGLDGSTTASSTHFTYNYGKDETWGVLYPAFADVLLNLSTFPSEAWTMQSNWYLKQMQPAGLPFAELARKGYPAHTSIWGVTDISESFTAPAFDSLPLIVMLTP